MKNLLLMRHAKSDWGNSSLSDFDRPLNERGLQSAPKMGQELLHLNSVPDYIVSSPASRARTTAELVANQCGYNNVIKHEKELYFGALEKIITIFRYFDDSYERIMVVGHNPTTESLIYKLLKDKRGIEMPTAAIASLVFDITSWNNLGLNTAILKFLITPKQL